MATNNKDFSTKNGMDVSNSLITNSDVYLDSDGYISMFSSDGTKYKLTVEDNGSLATKITPSFIGATGVGNEYSTSSSRTVGFPSDAVAEVKSGDLMLVMLSDDYTVPGWSDPSGWTQVFKRTGFDGTSSVMFWYKYATSSDTSFSISKTATGSSAPALTLSVFRGVNYSTYTSTTINTNTSPNINVSISGSVVVVGAFAQDEPQESTPSVPNGYFTASIANSLGLSSWMITGYKLNVLSGTQSPGDFSGINLENYMDVISVLLTPL